MPFRIRRTITQPDGSEDINTSGTYGQAQAAWEDANDQCDGYEDTMLGAVGVSKRTMEKEPGLTWTLELRGHTQQPTVLFEVFAT